LKEKLDINFKAHMIFEKMRNKHVKVMVGKYEKKNNLLAMMAFQRWHS